MAIACASIRTPVLSNVSHCASIRILVLSIRIPVLNFPLSNYSADITTSIRIPLLSNVKLLCFYLDAIFSECVVCLEKGDSHNYFILL